MQSLAALPFVGGHPALDFVNTAELRGHPLSGDVLQTADDLREWGARYGILDPAAGGADPDGEFTRAIGARELLYGIWSARLRGGEDDPDDLRRLAALAAEAGRAARLADGLDGLLRWRWDEGDLATVRHVAVASAVELLTQIGTARLGQCPGDHCGWFFLDTTKRGNRRWCSMSECGQEAKNAGRRRQGRAVSANAVTPDAVSGRGPGGSASAPPGARRPA